MKKQRLALAISAVLSIVGGTGCSTLSHSEAEPKVVVHHISFADAPQYEVSYLENTETVSKDNQFHTDRLAKKRGLGEFIQKKTINVFSKVHPQIKRAVYNHHENPTHQLMIRKAVAMRHTVEPPPLRTDHQVERTTNTHHKEKHATAFIKVNAFEREVNRLYAADKTTTSVQQTSRNSLWSRIISGYRLKADTEKSTVQRMLSRHLHNPKHLNRVFTHSGKYLHFILHELNRRGLPTELALLPMVESAYNNTSKSPTGAVGLWQLTVADGRHLGLRQTRQYDARMDVFASTHATLNKLQRLNRVFKGDWTLTLAAYKTGQHIVQREQMKNRYNGKPTDYWHLKLPKKTLNYLSELLAYREILLRPHAYGLTLPVVTNTPQVMQVVVNKSINLRKVAQAAGLPSSTLVNLNLNFKQAITNPHFSRKIVLPHDNAVKLHQAIRRQTSPMLAFYPPKKTIKH